jgi:hypothetical protein
MAKKGRVGQMEQMNKLRRDTTRPYRCRCANPYNAENAIVPFNFPRFIFLRVIAEQDWTCGNWGCGTSSVTRLSDSISTTSDDTPSV